MPYLHSPPPVLSSRSTAIAPVSFSLIGWWRGAAAPRCLHLCTQRGLPGTNPAWLDVCFWGWGGDGCMGLAQHLTDQRPLSSHPPAPGLVNTGLP